MRAPLHRGKMPGRRDDDARQSEVLHAIRPLRRRGPRVRHHDAEDAVPVDQLPRVARASSASISHQAGGYCFYRDARLRRLTRYRYNNVPTDVGGRYFYINDGGDVWTPDATRRSRRELDSFECRHGLGYTQITGERKGVARRAAASSCRSATPPRSTRSRSRTPGTTPKQLQALLVRRVLPVERLRRHDQLPAQLQHRRGRGRRAARSTTRPSTASGATTTRSTT